jgi:hypothetical protein
MEEIKIIEFHQDLVPEDLPKGTKMYQTKECLILVNKENGKHHLVISHAKRYPTIDEIQVVRKKLLPEDIKVIMLLPVEEQKQVNRNEKGFHLWEQ